MVSITTGVRMPAARSRQGFGSAQAGHFHVKQDNFGGKRQCLEHAFLTAADRGHNLYPSALQQFLQALAHERMDVNQQDAHA